MLRAVVVLLIAVASVAVIPAGPPALAAIVPPPSLDSFYTPPSPLPSSPPGTVLRSRAVTIPLPGVSVPVLAWQVMYLSTSSVGQPVAVTGTIMVPGTAQPRPLVSYAVGTVGLYRNCAPSYPFRTGWEYEAGVIAAALNNGWTVAATDYEGLGVPGPHTYTAGPASGNAVLDMARAAKLFPQDGLDPSGPVALWGYSEGGLAAAWASERQPSYAPELHIVGTAEGGVATDLAGVVRYVDHTVGSGVGLAGLIGQATAYQDLPFTQILSPAGQLAVSAEKGMCVEQIISTFPFQSIDSYFTVPDILSLPAWQARLSAQLLPQSPPPGPVYLYDATLDEAIPVTQGRTLFHNYCTAGVTVQYVEIPLVDHLGGGVAGAPGAAAWLKDRFAQNPAPSSC